MRKTSVKALARQAVRDDAKARAQAFRKPAVPGGKSPTAGQPLVGAVTMDNFVNFAHKLGIGADNALSSATYGFNPITRNRQLLEWMYRGSWLAGVAIDCVAEDMTRAGIDFVSQISPQEAHEIESEMTALNIWPSLAKAIKWGRLYGGGLAVHMIDGQDFKTPLRVETIGPDQYRGLLVLDRWMVQPELSELVDELGPDLGKPKYYTVLANSPALRNTVIHYSRIAIRHIGIELPYQQALTENLWGESVLERIHDRMIAYDSASTGAAQLVYKAYLRTFKVEGLRDIVAAGGAPMQGLLAYVENLRRYQTIEGLSLIDKEDEMEFQHSGAFSGLSDALMQFAQQLSGALQVPLTRLLGQSPAGLNSTGESDTRNYYDGISQRQTAEMHTGVTTTLRCVAQSKQIDLDDDFKVAFTSLWQMKPEEKSTVAKTSGDAVGAAFEGGLIGRQTALKELRQIGKVTGVFTNITDEAIEGADDEVLPPTAELDMSQEHDVNMTKLTQQHQSKEADKGRQHQAKLAQQSAKTAIQTAKAKAKRTPLK